MSDDEKESFEISNYDLKYAKNPFAKRSRMSKEQAMLGVWADESSEDEQDSDTEGNSRRKTIKKTNIDFISSGKKDDSKKQDSDESVEEIERTSFRLNNTQIKMNNNEKNIGNWEKHTKGFGMKMLENMGWQKGMGIGKNLQGRSTPVEATVRKGKGAIGLYGAEHKHEKNDVESNQKTKKHSKDRGQWKKDISKQNKPKYVVKTAEEILFELDENDDSSKPNVKITQSTSKIKIIDMTGREQRVLHGYESLSRRLNRPDDYDENEESNKKTFDMPELVHNLDLLVSMTEEEIIKNDKQLKYHEDMIVSMSQEEKRVTDKIEQEKNQIESIEKILNIIEKCEQITRDTNMSIILDLFKKLKAEFYNEYKSFNLSELCVPLLAPIFSRLYFNWNPFCDEISRTLNLEIYAEWKQVLDDDDLTLNTNQRQNQMSTFHRLMWETWMPSVRVALQRHNVRHCLPIIDFLDAWSSLLPQWMIENILEQFVLPKLIEQVDEWNPLIDEIPIHAWIHPWLPLMKEKLDVLYPPIRQKLGNAIINWHPSDSSAKAILLPWKQVWSPSSWDIFMQKHIVPKLSQVLSEFSINPRGQNIDSWRHVQAWHDLIPETSYVKMIDEIFFPKWLFVLSSWLNSKPDYDEVSRWYLGWKSLFTERLLDHSTIKSKLTQGLVMMNQSVSGTQVSYTPHMSQTSTTQSLPTSVQMTSTPSITSFKDIIEKKAADQNVLFVPVRNRFQEGKQVYRLGGTNVFIDRNVVFSFKNGNWVPTSLNELF